MTEQLKDDFEYWVKLSEKKDKILGVVTLIEEQLQGFTKSMTEKDFECVTYHIFPFDTRVISVVMGNHVNNPRSFAISLEDIQILENGNLSVPIIRVYSWMGNCDTPDRNDFKIVLEKKLEGNDREIKVLNYGLLNVLVQVYDEIAKNFNLPSL